MNRVAELARESLALVLGADSAYFLTFALPVLASVLAGARTRKGRLRGAAKS